MKSAQSSDSLLLMQPPLDKAQKRKLAAKNFKIAEKLPIHSFERIAYIASGLEGKQRMRFIQNASAKKYITSSQYKYLKKCGLPPRDISDAIERQRHIPKRYNHYIRSKFWAERCDRYWQTHRKCCAICGATQYVQLHHTVYSHFGDEPDENLVALCGNHHRQYHAENGIQYKMTKKTKKFIMREQKRSI